MTAISSFSAPISVASSLGAINDAEALRLYLSHIGANNLRTRREYEREVARLALWTQLADKTIQTLTYVDLNEYLQTIGDENNLGVLADALNQTSAREMFERVFAIRRWRAVKYGQPVAIDRRRALNARPVLCSMFKWLVESGYRSPIAVPRIALSATTSSREAAMVDRTEAARASIAKRKLDAACWALVDASIEELDWKDPTVVTARTMLVWLRWTGARRSEFDGARCDDLSGAIERGGKQHVFWRVIGKGEKVRRIPLNAPMIDAYRRYANTLAVPFDGDFGRLTARPLFEMPRAGIKTGIGALRAATGVDLYRAVEEIAVEAAKRSNDAMQCARIRSLTPHWFRHRRAFELEANVSLSVAAQFLGHASVATTQIYSSAADLDLADAVYGAK
ncbi:MAG: hypothetical protein EAZ30_02770 [Betaproteobacteria bacterium]|nr:MAG: hypothetical protein EAZ30_02770 [Betaproteobacteria bacterium]